MPKTLSSLISPLSTSEFRSDYFSKQSVHIGGSPDKFKGLFDLARLREILHSSPVPHPTMKLVLKGQKLSASDASAIIEKCRDGATLILEGIDEYDARVGALSANIAREMGEPTRTNLYFSQPGHPGFNRHYDTHDVFILQIAGFKGWRIFDDTVKFPLFHQKQHASKAPETPMLERTLAPGDVLYIPRGHFHEATAQDEPSLHLTLGLYSRTGIDFLSWLADELRDDVRWRESFPLVFDEELPADGSLPRPALEHFHALRRILSDTLSDDDVLARYRMFCIAKDRPVQPFSVPLFEEKPASLQGDESFERPAYQRAVITTADDLTRVVVWGNVFSFGSEAEPLLTYIFSHEAFSVGDLLACDRSLTRDDVAVVLEGFLDRGIVTARRAS